MIQKIIVAAMQMADMKVWANIERGQQLPMLDTLAGLGRVLGVPIAEFLDEAEDERLIFERARRTRSAASA